MPKGGLEPPRPCEHCALNAARLPVSPLRHLLVHQQVIRSTSNMQESFNAVRIKVKLSYLEFLQELIE